MNEELSFKPLHDRVLVERLKADEKTPGGLFVPQSAQDKPQQGVVKAVGPGRVLESGQLREVVVKVGQRVLFGKYAGTEIKALGDDYLVISQDDILGVFEG